MKRIQSKKHIKQGHMKLRKSLYLFSIIKDLFQMMRFSYAGLFSERLEKKKKRFSQIKNLKRFSEIKKIQKRFS